MSEQEKEIKIQKTFGYALNGIKVLFKKEWKFTLYTIVAIILIILMIAFSFSLIDVVIIIIMIGLVFAAETLNTLVETIFDELSSKYSSKIQKIKDISAAFVLISIIIAVIVGILIFWPYLFG